MMRHPFNGIFDPTNSEVPAAKSEVSGRLASNGLRRRDFFGRAAAALAGFGAFLYTGRAQAQTPPSGRGTGFPEGGALQGGYSGGIRDERPPRDGTVTTYAIGEEGGGYPPPRDVTVTTYAIGEEGGGYPPPRDGGRVTTYALGEEGSYYPRPRPRPPGWATTYTVGEEGGGYYRRRRYTTQALGEEGGYYYYRRW